MIKEQQAPHITKIVGKSHVEFQLDFKPLIDCEILILFDSVNTKIYINAHGENEIDTDPGFAIFKKDGSSIFEYSVFDLPLSPEKQTLSEVTHITYLQLLSLKACAESNRAEQMFRSNRALFWIIIERLNKEKNYSKAILDKIFGCKRRELTKLILNSEQERSVKFLEKIQLLNGEKNELEIILNSAKLDITIENFKHWKSIPIQALYISERFPNLAGSNILQEWCKRDHKKMSDFTRGLYDVSRLFEDTIAMGERLNIKNSRNIVMQCKSLERLNKMHDNWVSLTIKSSAKFDPDIEFPSPSFDYPSWLIWIDSANKLISEGESMVHCVGTYVKKASSGKSMIFKVILEERATLELRSRGQKLEIVEIKKYKNETVSENTKEVINAWIRKHNDKGSHLS